MIFKHTLYSEKVIINAPVEQVWDILVDFAKYPDWNPFTYRVDTDLTLGNPVNLLGKAVNLYVRMPKRGDRIQREIVRIVDRPHRLAWGMCMGTAFFLSALREQRLEKIDATHCSYQTWDGFNGLLTPLVVGLFGEDIQNGFNAVAKALKLRAEAA